MAKGDNKPEESRAEEASKEDEFAWEELKNNSGMIFGQPAYVLEAAAFHAGMKTDKPLTKAKVQAAIDKFMKKEVETG